MRSRSTVHPRKKELVTHLIVPDDLTITEALSVIADVGGVWNRHSDSAPSWARSNNHQLARLVAINYGCKHEPDFPAKMKEWNLVPVEPTKPQASQRRSAKTAKTIKRKGTARITKRKGI